MTSIGWRRWNTYLLLAGAAHFALFYTLNTRPMLSMALFERGAEQQPFQYRALTAWIYGAADHLLHIPASLAAHLPPVMNSVDQFVTFALTFVSVVIAVLAARLALERLTNGNAAWSRWGSLLVLPMAYCHYVLEFGHPCCTPMQLPYDLPSVAFFAVCTALIVTDHLLWLYPAFALATLNRESAIFLVLLLGLYRSASFGTSAWRSRRALLTYAHMVGLALLWIALRVVLHRMYHPPPAMGYEVHGFEIHVLDNLGYLLRPYYWTSFLSLFGFTWIFTYAHWRDVPSPGVRRMLWIGPIYLLAMYIVGVLSEIRIFGELIAVYAIAFTLLLRELRQRWLANGTGGTLTHIQPRA